MPERNGLSPESQFSKAARQERSSSSLILINCHLPEKTLIECEMEISEEMSSIARRSPVDDSGDSL